jgi:hypothetical protein
MDEDVGSVADEGAEIVDLRAIEVDEVVLKERRLDRERIQRAPWHHFPSALRDMRARPGEGVDIHVVELGLLLPSKDC